MVSKSYKTWLNKDPNYALTKGLHGHAQTSDGHSYVLEYCGANGHVWKLMDIGHMAMEAEVALELPVQFKVWWFNGVDRI